MDATPDQIRNDRKRLRNPYAHIGENGSYRATTPESWKNEARRISQDPYAGLASDGSYDPTLIRGFLPEIENAISGEALCNDDNGKITRSNSSGIQRIARRLHGELWKRKHVLWNDHAERPRIKMLDPIISLELLGYGVEIVESLGQSGPPGRRFEVAGEIDNLNKRARISGAFEIPVRNFTAAHELGHAILHPEIVELHRDRALDGTGSGPRASIEWQADIFATHFLMPERLVVEEFKASFLSSSFNLTEDTAFALETCSLQEIETRIRTTRELSRIVASAQHFSGVHFLSMAERFGVSVEAMAIRLEELNLIDYP